MTMELQNAYYNFILKGTKRIELRLFDEKRQKIKLGDIITVTNAQTNEEFECVGHGLQNRTGQSRHRVRIYSERYNKYKSKEEMGDVHKRGRGSI